MRSKWIGRIGFIILACMVVIAIFASYITPHDPFLVTGSPFETPSYQHWLGTNDIGQDIFSELIYGSRTSLLVGFISALISTTLAIVTGGCAGWFGGWVDRLLMKVSTFFITIPFIPALIILAAFTNPSIWSTSIILGVMSWAGVARIIRSETMLMKTHEHIVVIRAMGADSFYILTRHIIRNLLPIIMYRFVAKMKSGILSESSLAFLGLGNAVSKSWGSMIYYAQNRNALLTGAWVWWIIPAGVCICLVSFALVLISYAMEIKQDLRYG